MNTDQNRHYFCAFCAFLWLALSLCLLWLLFYGDPVAQLFEVARCDLLIRGESGFDLDQVAFRLARLYESLFCVTVVDHVDTADSRFRRNCTPRYKHCRLGALL